jgi:hypothetical protein
VLHFQFGKPGVRRQGDQLSYFVYSHLLLAYHLRRAMKCDHGLGHGAPKKAGLRI